MISKNDYFRKYSPTIYLHTLTDDELNDLNDSWIEYIKDYDYVIVTSSKSYDPEGLDIDDDNSFISCAGTYDELKDYVDELCSHEKYTKLDDDIIQIYFYNNQSYSTYSIVETSSLFVDKGRSI